MILDESGETNMARLRLSKVAGLFSLAASLLSFNISAAEPPLPNASLEVTVRQKQEGMLGKGLHLFHLWCWQGECSLTVLSLNQCGPGAHKPSFYPKVERFSTRDNNLKVSDVATVYMSNTLMPTLGD